MKDPNTNNNTDTQEKAWETFLNVLEQSGQTQDALELIANNILHADHVDKKFKSTPLMLACYYGHNDLVKLILSKDVDLNRSDQEGNTALIAACFSKEVDALALLLLKKADIHVINKKGETALSIAFTEGNQDIIAAYIKGVLTQDFRQAFQTVLASSGENKREVFQSIAREGWLHLILNKIKKEHKVDHDITATRNVLEEILSAADGLIEKNTNGYENNHNVKEINRILDCIKEVKLLKELSQSQRISHAMQEFLIQSPQYLADTEENEDLPQSLISC